MQHRIVIHEDGPDDGIRTQRTESTARGSIPTLTDVARLAGVSRQTASRVARGSSLVNPKTAARVAEAIAVLGYRPNELARALSTGSSHSLGFVLHSASTFGGSSLLASVEVAATAAGYRITIASLSHFDVTTVQTAVDDMVRIGCDGIILSGPWSSDSAVVPAVSAPVPMVTTSEMRHYAGPGVHPDASASAVEATRHLLDLGHETVWHVSGPGRWTAATLRERGWRAALESAGAPVPPVIAGDWTSDSGYRAGLDLSRREGVTAVLAANDHSALGLIHAFVESGLRVPADISVVGFDDSPGSAHFLPPLTTVRSDRHEQGRLTVDVLLRQLRGEQVRSPIIVPHQLVVRESTAPPP